MPKIFQRLSNGELPSQTWPGLYPLLYLMEDGGIICADCANQKNGSLAEEGADDPQWNIVDQFIFHDGEPIECAHCNEEITPADYAGDVSADEDERCDWCRENGTLNCRHMGM